jgi:hypothetical protein
VRLIVEKMDDEVFVYLESEQQYFENETARLDEGSRRLPPALLREECDLSIYASGVHWVFNVNAEGVEDDEDEECCDEATEDFDCDESRCVRDCPRRRESR